MLVYWHIFVFCTVNCIQWGSLMGLHCYTCKGTLNFLHQRTPPPPPPLARTHRAASHASPLCSYKPHSQDLSEYILIAVAHNTPCVQGGTGDYGRGDPGQVPGGQAALAGRVQAQACPCSHQVKCKHILFKNTFKYSPLPLSSILSPYRVPAS